MNAVQTLEEVPWSHDLPWPAHLTPFDPFDTVIQADPYAHYAWMRRHAPVIRAGRADAPLYIVARFADVTAGLRNAAVFSSNMGSAALLPGFLLNFDPPAHTELRRSIASAFTPRAMKSAERTIRSIVQAHWARILARGGGEVVSDFASPCTIEIISSVLSIAVEDSLQVRDLTRKSIVYIGQLLRGLPGEGDASAYLTFKAFVGDALRASDPGSDTIAANIHRLAQEAQITFDEATGFATLLFMAGHETTTLLMGNCLDLLAERPDLLPSLADSDAARLFVEEVVRFRPPVQRLTRRAATDTVLGGYRIPAESSVRFLIASANRDEQINEDGETFDPFRSVTNNVGFGYGVHLCIGAWLARLETAIALQVIAQSTRTMARDPDIARIPLAGGAFATTGLDALGLKLVPVDP